MCVHRPLRRQGTSGLQGDAAQRCTFQAHATLQLIRIRSTPHTPTRCLHFISVASLPFESAANTPPR
ncbi:unnamed protein product [Vitrella brassicaformis CCMP3155]|uniref:Uncharacterized protein n=1 Tax=Vitrella brassicaformis (strain CCMP3155) TaxID=1169540 RepID=A0A0G4ERB3_VITBC|nr:unnamed protein product [Vitrella brassicaformis CCMP3155]|eukprot:CEM00803.1 unnamed protein product [Vitrella brassicaformis CCMP3155]